MTLRDFLIKKFAKDEEFKAAEKHAKIQRLIEERQKSANERELDKYFNEQREAKIKMQLDKIRMKQKHEFFTTSLMDKTNIFKNHKNILENGTSVMGKVSKGQQMFFK